MASNPDENSAPRNNNGGRSRGGSNWRGRNWRGANRSTGPRQRPVAVLIPQGQSNDDQNASLPSGAGQPTRTSSYRINRKSGPYHGWQLYFPEIGNEIE